MSGNFDRTLSREDVLRRRASLLQRLHIDGLLLVLLLVLAAGSLFILYSASGRTGIWSSSRPPPSDSASAPCW